MEKINNEKNKNKSISFVLKLTLLIIIILSVGYLLYILLQRDAGFERASSIDIAITDNTLLQAYHYYSIKSNISLTDYVSYLNKCGFILINPSATFATGDTNHSV